MQTLTSTVGYQDSATDKYYHKYCVSSRSIQGRLVPISLREMAEIDITCSSYTASCNECDTPILAQWQLGRYQEHTQKDVEGLQLAKIVEDRNTSEKISFVWRKQEGL